MSQITTPPVNAGNKPSAPGSASSAWARGPPSAAASTPASAIPSGANTPSQGSSTLPNGVNTNGASTGANGFVPVAVGGGHARKSSLLVGGGIDIQRGSINFGTVDSPNPMLSSSPAAPSTTGGHLADSVKSFGSIDADASSDPNAVKTRRLSSLAPSSATSPVAGAPAAKKLDMHSLFAGKPHPASTAATPAMSPPQQPAGAPAHIRRQSMGQSGFQGPNGLPNSPYAGHPHLRPPVSGLPNQPRSPVVNQSMGPGQFNASAPPQVQQGFRPPQGGIPPQQSPVRPNGVPQGIPRPGMMMGPQMGPYGMHPPQGPQYQMMGYQPQSGYYGQYNPYEQQQFGINPSQWAPQQHPQNQQYNGGFNQAQQSGPMSPRAAQAQIPVAQSPLPPSATLPSSGAASPAPTPPTRPPSLMSGHQQTPSSASVSVPATPSRPMPPTFAPQQSTAPSTPGFPQLSGGAPTFTPRRPATIKISRPDGTAFDIKEVAKAAVKPTLSSAPSSGAATPELPSETPAEVPKKKLPTLPVIVRIESEDQKKKRLAEEAERERIKKIEEQEEQERKERQERKVKEEEERKIKEASDKAEQEKLDADAKSKADAATEKKKLEDAFEAEQATARKVAEEKEAAAKLQKELSEKAEQEAHAAAQEAREKADEQRRALLTPTPSASTPASPLGSPALGAGLPAKPVAAISGARRAVPSSLDLKPSSPALTDDSPTASVSAATTARSIEDLSSIVYPASTKPLNPSFYVEDEPGKFRYDRDFLMQFMGLCREKPDSLPPLEEIGLEADATSGFGSRAARGGRSSMGPSSRNVSGAPTGLGIGGINRPSFPGQGMGSFGMGQFGSGSGSLRGTTSEQRYQAALRASGMGRTPSQGGPGGLPSMSGLPSMGPSTSRSGASRGSQRGTKRAPQERASLQQDPAMAPLQISGNAWTRTRLGGDDEGSPAFIERKVKALLNKLTEEKFDGISKQILEWANKSQNETDGMTLKLVIKLIFEKATDEAHWSAMYAKLCRLLLVELDPAVTEVLDGKPTSGGALFRKYLLGRCQMDFEAGWKAREDTAVAAAAKSDEDKERLAKHEQEKEEGADAALLSDEYYAAQKAKRRGLGLVQLIGELYKLEMVSKGVIRQCLIRLLGNVTDPDEEDIESTCKLLTTIGRAYDAAAPENMNTVFERLNQVNNSESLSSRIKFMVMDIMDLRRNKWQSRNKQAGVMTIAEIHQQAAQEKAAASAQASQQSISRGGSRTGHARRDGPQPGEWQSVSAGPRIARPADFSGIGRNISSSGMPAAPTFGPSSVFARKGKPGAAGSVTPPLSRQPSSANMFSALNEATEAVPAERRPSADAGEPVPQRKRLNLAPRTKPLPGDDDEKENEDEGESGDEADVPAEDDEMTEDAAKSKIALDLKELWGEKDQGGSRNPDDIAEYFRALPEVRRPLLADRLAEDVFRIAKLKDAEVVAKGWKVSLEQGATTPEVLKQALDARMPTLDDEAIDFPAAYKAIALLIRSVSLSSEEVDALVAKIEIDGEPRVTPKMKLDKALAQVEEESASA